VKLTTTPQLSKYVVQSQLKTQKVNSKVNPKLTKSTQNSKSQLKRQPKTHKVNSKLNSKCDIKSKSQLKTPSELKNRFFSTLQANQTPSAIHNKG